MEVISIYEQEAKYKEYIDNHRQNVQKAWSAMKSNSDCIKLINENLQPYSINMINDYLIPNHDLSKYSKEEFDAYRKEFYPISEEEKEKNKENFNEAWKHHYHNNLHHWNWWYETNKMYDMSLMYVVEMICDWEAMGYKFGNNSLEYYNKNKDSIHLGFLQRQFAEALMVALCK